jgi:hypothetical protein
MYVRDTELEIFIKLYYEDNLNRKKNNNERTYIMMKCYLSYLISIHVKS